MISLFRYTIRHPRKILNICRNQHTAALYCLDQSKKLAHTHDLPDDLFPFEFEYTCMDSRKLNAMIWVMALERSNILNRDNSHTYLHRRYIDEPMAFNIWNGEDLVTTINMIPNDGALATMKIGKIINENLANYERNEPYKKCIDL